MMKKVSLIVPIYNLCNGGYLYRCLNSLVNQTYPNIEIIIINDGSTDNSDGLCRKFADDYNNIIYISKKNEGVSVARNVALDIAAGDYIGFVDGDDYVEKDYVSSLVEAIETTDSDIAICNYKTITENQTVICNIALDEGFRDNQAAMKELLEDKSFHFFMWNKLFKSILFDNLRFTPGIRMEDYLICPEIMSKCKGVYIINKYLYLYDQSRSDSFSNGNYGKKWIDIYNANFRVYQKYKDNYPELIDMWLVSLAGIGMEMYVESENLYKIIDYELFQRQMEICYKNAYDKMPNKLKMKITIWKISPPLLKIIGKMRDIIKRKSKK